MSDAADHNTRILGALIGGFAHTAHVVSEMLAHESLTVEDRVRLRAVLGAGVIMTAKAIDEALPGRGDAIINIYTGGPADGTASTG